MTYTYDVILKCCVSVKRYILRPPGRELPQKRGWLISQWQWANATREVRTGKKGKRRTMTTWFEDCQENARGKDEERQRKDSMHRILHQADQLMEGSWDERTPRPGNDDRDWDTTDDNRISQTPGWTAAKKLFVETREPQI